jgi:protein-tyrosine phosphatase
VGYILFLCYGNICRSPFAERYAQATFPGRVHAASAGVFPTDGRPSPEAAQAAARRFGISLGDHASRIVTPTMLRDADVIFVFDARNHLHVRERGRAHLDKTYYLSDLDLSEPVQVADPWGEDAEAFVRTYRRIKEALDSALLPMTAARGSP